MREKVPIGCQIKRLEIIRERMGLFISLRKRETEKLPVRAFLKMRQVGKLLGERGVVFIQKRLARKKKIAHASSQF